MSPINHDNMDQKSVHVTATKFNMTRPAPSDRALGGETGCECKEGEILALTFSFVNADTQRFSLA